MAASNGASAGSAGSDCESTEKPCLLVARRPGQRHPVKAKPLRGGARRASLDRLSLAQRGLSKQVRLIGSVDAPIPTQRAGVGFDPKEELAK